jgi:hypothetical protein
MQIRGRSPATHPVGDLMMKLWQAIQVYRRERWCNFVRAELDAAGFPVAESTLIRWYNLRDEAERLP